MRRADGSCQPSTGAAWRGAAPSRRGAPDAPGWSATCHSASRERHLRFGSARRAAGRDVHRRAGRLQRRRQWRQSRTSAHGIGADAIAGPRPPPTDRGRTSATAAPSTQVSRSPSSAAPAATRMPGLGPGLRRLEGLTVRALPRRLRADQHLRGGRRIARRAIRQPRHRQHRHPLVPGRLARRVDAGPVWRRAVDDRYHLVLLDEQSRAVRVAVIHPGSIPAAARKIVPALPNTLSRSDVDGLLALRLPK